MAIMPQILLISKFEKKEEVLTELKFLSITIEDYSVKRAEGLTV